MEHESAPAGADSVAPSSGVLPGGGARRVLVQLGTAVLYGLACSGSWMLAHAVATEAFGQAPTAAQEGSMWALLSTAVVFPAALRSSRRAGVERALATVLSVVLCSLYVLVLPVEPAAFFIVPAAGAALLLIAERPQLLSTTTITSAVVLTVAGTSRAAWSVPLMRLVESVYGILFGVAAAGLVHLLSRAHAGGARDARR